MQRIGVLGGSFNPVHLAHLVVAESVREALGLARVLFVPVYRQPLKPDEALAPPADRLEMLRLALAGNPAFKACPLELEREGLSYTIDTLVELARRHRGAELFLILGEDAYGQFHRWRRSEEVRGMARLVVVPRAVPREPAAGQAGDSAPKGGTSMTAAPGPSVREESDVLRVAAPVLEISASEIRARAAGGASIRYLVPEPVRTYILERGLYR